MALHVAQSITYEAPGGTTGNLVFSTSVHSGNVILVCLSGWNGANNQPNVFPITVTDNVNSNTYNAINPTYFPTHGSYFGVGYWVRTNATGTPNVQITSANGWGATLMSIADVYGWTGTPTIDTGASVSSQNTNSANTVQGGSVTTAFINEIVFAAPWNQSYINSVPSGWTQFGVGTDNNYYAIEPTPTTLTFAGPLAGPSDWTTVFGGLYDATSLIGLPTRMYANGAVSANTFVSGGLPAGIAMRFFANGTVQTANTVYV